MTNEQGRIGGEGFFCREDGLRVHAGVSFLSSSVNLSYGLRPRGDTHQFSLLPIK